MKARFGRRPLLAVVIVGMAAAIGGIAYAAIPDANDVIHACYNPNGAKTPSGASLSVIDSDSRSCPKGQTELTWNKTGPPGADGVSVTSEALAADPTAESCPDGGSKFTAAGDNVTFACNGAKGDPGEDGQDGDTGPPGPTDAYTNYGDGQHAIPEFATQTVASVTVPAGSYALSGSVAVGELTGSDFAQCQFVAAGVHGQLVLIQNNGRAPVIGDITVSGGSNPIFLRCTAASGASTAVGEMIATRVGTITPSE